MTGGDAIPLAKTVPSARESIEVVADGLYSSHGTGALAGAFLGVHVRSAGGGIHHFAVEQIVQLPKQRHNRTSIRRHHEQGTHYHITGSLRHHAVGLSGPRQPCHVWQGRPGWKDIGSSKELIEQHSLCAGCPESMAFRYVLAALPNPEDTVMVGSTGCTSLVFPHVAIHNIHSLFGNQNAVASGLKRALTVRFPNRIKDVVVLAGDGATVDIGLDMTLQAWFRQEKFTTICFDNELYANTGGQESGLMQKGFVAKMAPVGKLFDKVRLPEIARESGCHYIVNCTVSKPSVVEKVIRNAVLIAREIGPTYVQLYTPCILEIGKDSMEGLQEMRDSEKPNERFAFKEYVSDPAKALLAELAAKAKERKAAEGGVARGVNPPRRLRRTARE